MKRPVRMSHPDGGMCLGFERGRIVGVTALSDIERRLDAVVHAVVPQRAGTAFDVHAVEDLMAVGREMAELARNAELVPRSLVGTSWHAFTAMLTAAEYALDPEPILEVAWQWEDLLHQAFGPDF